ncbi:MAG: tetratricopeptide repeat protein [bacterium]
MNELSPQNEDIYPREIREEHRQGVICFNVGDYKEAENVFNQLLQKYPNMSEAHLNLGNVYFKQKRTEDAIKAWRKALSIDSAQVNCYINLGKAYYSMEQYDEAINHWIIAITMAPNHSSTIMNLGAAYEKLGDLSTAYKYYEDFLEMQDSSLINEYRTVYVKIANIKKIALHNLKMGIKYQKQENLRNAILAYKESIKSYPNFPKAHLNMGSICYMAEKYEHAIKYWLNSINLDPAYAKTYCNVAVAYDKIHNYSYAYCYYKRYVEIEKTQSQEIENIKKRMDALFNHFSKKTEQKQQHLDKAKDFYRKKFFKEALIEYENYSFVNLDGKAEVESRIQELRYNLNPKLKAATTAYEIANTCYAQQKFDKAIEAYKRYLQFDPCGKYADDAKLKMLECGKLMSRALKAFMAVNS